MAALVLLMAVVALVEGLGMALLLPLLGAIGVATAADGGAVTELLDRLLSVFNLNASAYHVAALLLAIFAAQLLLYVAQQWWIARLQRDYCSRWQTRLFQSFIHAKWDFFADQKLGYLTSLITQETQRLGGALFTLAQLASTVVVALVYLVIGVLIAWQVTALMIGLAAALLLLVRGLGRKNFQVGLRLGPLASELNVLLTEYFGGAKLIKATATEAVAGARVNHVVDELRVQHTWATFLPALVRAIFEFSAIAALCFILVFGYQTLSIAAGSMLVVLALFVRLLPRFNALQQNVHLLAMYVPAFGVVEQMFQAAEAASERSSYSTAAGTPYQLSGPLTIAISRGGYPGRPILRDVSLRLPERGLVGVVGESGAGKSTLANCLLGLAEIEAGTVSFGDVEMRDVPLNVWRRQIGYVTQDTVLFHLSIRENIAWGVPGASDEDVEIAARQALAHDFILEQPGGYSTVIGDQGVRLSGGQRQRLSIARALLARPRLLVMDEATNALDSTSEALVLETVSRLRKEICIVMVAHRLATVRDADLIVVLDKGRVIESGTWHELIARRGSLAHLASMQHIDRAS